MDKEIKDYFDKHGIRYVAHEHEAIFTVEEGKKLKQNIPGMHCKTLFLKDDLGRFYLIGMRADKRLDTKKLRNYLNVKKLHFGSEEELFETLKLKPGSVSIFGMINDLGRKVKLIIDKEVWNADTTGFHPNVNTATLEVKHADLERFYESIKSDKEIIEL